MANTAEQQPGAARKSAWAKASPATRFLLIAANLLSVGCLVWALHDAKIEQLGQEIRELDWRWVVVGVVADILVYVCQGWRWSILLQPIAKASLGQSVRAIYVGLFANEILPFRSGELIRCYLQARWSKLAFPVVLTSALVERVFDGLWLMTFFLIALNLTELPNWVDEFAYALALLITVLAALIATILLFRKQSEAWLVKPPARVWKAKVFEIIEDLHTMGRARSFPRAFLASLPYLAMQVVPIYALMKAYGFEGPVLGPAAVVMLVLRLGTVVPSAPGNLGTFQVLAAQGLALFIDDAAMAKRFSFLLWSLITLPLLLGGFVALAWTGLRLRQVQEEAQEISYNSPRSL